MPGEHQWKQGLEVEKGVAVERMTMVMCLILRFEERRQPRDEDSRIVP